MNSAAHKEEILKIDSLMTKALNDRDLDTWLSHITENARMMPPNAPILEGKTEISAMISELLAVPNFLVVHHPPDKITISDSGDLAYIGYSYELTVPDSEGGSITDKGKDLSVFEKQGEGNWKLVVDMWSSNE
ncbi:MAG: DUF4440 domain-containing protein [Pseudomonadales bacterium]|nr:DUF4440 domain-containing protein [Pseudomonadales bacterium]